MKSIKEKVVDTIHTVTKHAVDDGVAIRDKALEEAATICDHWGYANAALLIRTKKTQDAPK